MKLLIFLENEKVSLYFIFQENNLIHTKKHPPNPTDICEVSWIENHQKIIINS